MGLLGAQIRLARLQRRMTQVELAERLGVSHMTMTKIEQGDLSVSVGSVFEAAAIAGVTLFDADPDRRAGESRRVRDLMALLPDAVRERPGRVRDDF